MPGYINLNGNIGVGPLNELLGPADTTKRYPVGMCADGLDPYFGYGKFLYLQFPLSQAVTIGRLVMISDQTGVVADLPAAALQGYPFLVARQACASSATPQYGWFQNEGICPIQTNATVAAGVKIAVAAAGVAGTLVVSQQLVNTRVLQSATFTIAKTNTQTTNGSAVVQVTSIDGLFVGLTISGTGVTGTITAISTNGRDVTLSANATATGTITATFTYTGFGLVHISNPFAQGAIT
jgi:hypothetical protein